jgi:hypothetical protein
VIRTLPLAPRNRLANTILLALSDGEARKALTVLADDRDVSGWLETTDATYGSAVVERARAAAHALAGLPLLPREMPRETALAVAATLFDAGLGFEVHEFLETYWRDAGGLEREALQGLVQVAVGYQHWANGNRSGARTLLTEGAARLAIGRLDGLPITAFATAVRASLTAARGDDITPPPFPRAPA